MARTSKSEVSAVFSRLCAAVGVTPHLYDRDPYSRDSDGRLNHAAGWSLDNNPTYGGYVIAGHSGEGTGESAPMGDRRMPAGEFVRAMHFAIRAIEASRES